MSVWAKIKGIFSPIDMTRGPIVKSLLLFLIPTALSMLFQQFYTLTDAAIVGRICGKEDTEIHVI
jgi:Na+-driven multidrug efflux pump